LSEDLQTEVVIVGGGLAGVSAAYCLSEAGKKIILIEDGHIGSGETGRTTAHLVTALDDRYTDLEKIYGEKDTALIADSHMSAIKFVEQTIAKENISCQFVRLPGYLFMHPSDKENALDEEYEAARKAGIPVRKLNTVPGMLYNPGPCLEFADQGQFHPLMYMHGLCEAIVKRGRKNFH
jgi:glycine/D-amino acid oxidase-like deaminating enzyme